MDGSLETITKGMTGERKEVFERVWRRVMHSGAAEDAPLPEEDSLTQNSLALPAPPADLPGSDFPPAPGVLGEGCREYAGLLQGLLRGALEDWRSYQALARRAGGGPGRVQAAQGAEERRRAKELSAVCFLISGAKLWPDPEKGAVTGAYLGSLRRFFRREQETMAAYLAAAETVTDPCLRELFLRHAGQAWDHSCRLRSLVEQA